MAEFLPRYAPARPLPPYAHRPGRTPHPRRDPAGHSYGAPEPDLSERLEPGAWAANERYLFAFDLYNRGYWWEAHEEWEGLWLLADRASPVRSLLQGLIQVSAAMVKWEQGNGRGLEGLGRRGLGRLRQVAAVAEERVMGLEVAAFAAQLEAFLAAPDRSGGPPPLRLRGTGLDPV